MVNWVSMEDVPEPLLLEIFGQISCNADRKSVAQVCKRFYRIEGEQRRSLRVGSGLHPVTDALNSLCIRFTKLTKVEIDYSGWMSNLGKQLDDQGLFVLSSRCPSLTDLTLSFCSFITDAGLGYLSSLINLRCLDLNFAPSISSNGLLSVVVGCKNLSTLHLSRCMKVKSVEWLEYIGKFGVLKDLSVKNCRAIWEEDLLKLGSSWSTLICLELEVDYNYRDSQIHSRLPIDRGEQMQHITCGALKQIRLGKCNLTPRRGLSCVLRSCKALEKLYLDMCFGIRDIDITVLAQNSSSLKCISLRLPSQFVAPGLENNPSQLTDEGLKALSSNCSALQEVEISFSDGEFPSLSVFSQSGILSITQCCPIRALVLDCVYLFNDIGMKALCSANFLEVLELVKCQEVSDEGVELVIHFPRLMILTLRKCLGITDAGLKPLVGLYKLESLTVQDCPQISEQGLQGAARSVSYEQDLSWLF